MSLLGSIGRHRGAGRCRRHETHARHGQSRCTRGYLPRTDCRGPAGTCTRHQAGNIDEGDGGGMTFRQNTLPGAPRDEGRAPTLPVLGLMGGERIISCQHTSIGERIKKRRLADVW